MIQNIEEHSMGWRSLLFENLLFWVFAEKYGTPALVIEKSVLQNVIIQQQ